MYFYSNRAVNKAKPSFPTTNNMDEGSTALVDAFHVGSHCQLKSCNKLDYLPWTCDRCKLKFCADHRKYEDHKCAVTPPSTAFRNQQQQSSSTGQSIQSSRMNTFQSPSCGQKGCKTVLNGPTSPATECICRQLFCLKHRHPSDHDCPGAKEIKKSALLSNTTLSKETLLEKLKDWSLKRKSSISSTSQKGGLLKGLIRTKSNQSSNPIVQRGLQINQLRKDAKGDNKIAEEKRVYVHGEGPPNLVDGTLTSAAQVLRKPVFFSKEWSNGKVLDRLAETLGVQNRNNSTGDKEKRLQLFHIESGTLLEMERKIGEVVKNGDTIVIARGW